MNHRRWLFSAIAAVVLATAGVLIWMFTRPAETVEVVNPQMREVVEIVIASGSLRAKRQSSVGAEVTGTVQDVLVDEGDRVARGDILIRLDRQEVQQQLDQARLAVQTAQRQLELAQRGPLPEEIARARAQLSQARRVGQARLDAALERLRELERGGREPERARARAELRRAQANLKQAQIDYNRTLELVRRGAISAAELDRARTALSEAREAVSVAEQQLQLAVQPASQEQIAAARADVRAARAELQESVRVAQANLNELLSLPRIEDVQVARARLQEAQAAVRQAQEQLNRRIINAPLSGLVTRRDVEPGQSVTPGQELLTIADMSTAEISVETDESNLPKLEVGQPATIVAPPYPNRPFSAVLRQIGPEVSAERGVVMLRLTPVSLPDYARPDMTVDANIEVERLSSVLSVPVTSILEQDGQTYVLIVRSDVARRNDVEVLARGSRWVGVSGVERDARVIVNGADVEPSQRVRVAEEN